MIYVQLQIFVISLILASNLILKIRGVSLWLIESAGVGQEFDSAAPPHDTTAQTLAPNESLLRRLGLQMT